LPFTKARRVRLSWALQTSRLEYLMYLKSSGNLRPLQDAESCLRKLALAGNYRLLKFYHQNLGSISNFSLIDEASAIGHLNLVKWLHSIGSNASTLAMDWSTEKGHLEVLKWLHTNRNDGCTYLGLRFAVVNGHVDVVRYLLDKKLGKVDFKLSRTALEYERLEILSVLMDQRSLDNREMRKLVNIANEKGNVAALKSLNPS
jgi:hypothetical protein